MIAVMILAFSLLIGVVGFCLTDHVSWAEAFHNSSMLLSGMGPVIQKYPTTAAVLFSSFYALFSGIVFIANIGVILTPVMHRVFHRLHLEENATS